MRFVSQAAGTGIFTRPFASFVLPLTIITLVGTLVESLPYRDVDNITVTLAAVLAGLLLF